MHVIVADSLSKSYQVQQKRQGVLGSLHDLVNPQYSNKLAVKNASFVIDEGELVGFIGPNGAGKTTTIRMILGILEKDSGRVDWDQKAVTRENVRFGYLPEERGIYPKAKVSEQLHYFARLRGMSYQEAKASMDYWLERLKATEYTHQVAEQLSKGNQQKIQLISAIIHDPELLILDEPFSGVDPLAVYDVQEIIRGLKKKGLGILITDHNVRETLTIVDRAYLICEGKVLREGTSSFLIDDPLSRELYLGPRFSM